jgi:hypothetical protein
VLEKGEAFECQPQALWYLPLRAKYLFQSFTPNPTCPLSMADSSVFYRHFFLGPIPSI